MRIAKLIFLLLTVMPCLTFAVLAQTTTSSEVSRAGEKQDDKVPSATSIAANKTSEGNPAPSNVRASAGRNVQGASEKWEFTFAPYLWLAGIDGTVGVGDFTTEIDPGFSDILNSLNFGFMGVFEARKNKFSLITDVTYISLEERKDTTGTLFSALQANEKTFLLSPVAGYRLAGKEGASLDAIAGIRFWHTSTRLEAEPQLLHARTVESSKNWADVIGGLRGQAHVARRVSLIGRADVGGGGSDYTYQLFGGAGIDVSKNATLFAGYRYLFFKYTRDDFLFDGALNGAVLGARFRF
jgi:opacity protein-like surface antigen